MSSHSASKVYRNQPDSVEGTFTTICVLVLLGPNSHIVMRLNWRAPYKGCGGWHVANNKASVH